MNALDRGRAVGRRWLRRLEEALAPDVPSPEASVLPIRPLWAAGAEETTRWNAEWLRYLGREWERQLEHHSVYGDAPPLPASALQLLEHRFTEAPPLALYADPDGLQGRAVMELGCGCGNLGKLLGRYADNYLGVDYSPLALRIAGLVSPPNCTYRFVADRAELEPFFGSRDTVVGRYFFIHQNAELAGHVLDYAADFLASGGRLYADFYWPDPEQVQGVVLSPDSELSPKYPSATFKYDRHDVERLVAGKPYRILREEIVPRTQRRYVVLERR